MSVEKPHETIVVAAKVDEKVEPSRLLFTSKQQGIYINLKQIGEEIAAFYLAGIRILNDDNLPAKANLLAHVAREIDGGLRDVFVLKKEEERCVSCGKVISSTSHFDSICLALGVTKDDPLAKKWFKVATRFHGFAHRRGAWKTAREIDEFEPLWHEYEDVLFEVVGSYYKLLDRIDVIIKTDVPSNDILSTLPNLFNVEAREHYFFTKLDKPSWLSPLAERGFFDPERNPKPVKNPDGGESLPRWRALYFLETIASKNLNDQEFGIVLSVIKRIIDYREDGKRIVNQLTDYQIFKIICALPSERITADHIAFVAEALISEDPFSFISSDISKILIPKLIRDKNKPRLLELIKVITRFKLNEKSLTDKIESIFDKYWFPDLVTKNSQAISAFCGLDVVRILIDRIREIVQADPHSFNNAWIPTIEDHPQNTFQDRYEAVLIRFLRDLLLCLDTSQLESLIVELLSDGRPILRRVAIFILNQRFSEFNNLPWQNGGNSLESYELKHEFYELLKNHAKDLSTSQMTIVIGWIESLKLIKSKENEKVILARLKKEWYSALLDSKNNTVLENYQIYNEISPEPIDHPGFDFWLEIHRGDPSPLLEIELAEMSNENIAKYLVDFKEQDGILVPSAMGLAETFTKTVKANPYKFSSEICAYNKLPLIYRHALIEGFCQAWNDNKAFDWAQVLNYILHTLQEGKREESRTGFDYYDWFIAQCCILIQEGTKSDSHAFDPELLPLAKKILLQVNSKVIPVERAGQDYVNFTINSTKGKLLEAMLQYSLRLARFNRSRVWDADIREVFDTEIQLRPSVELHTLLGLFIGNFLYLDEQWFRKNLLKVFPNTSTDYFQAALTGYLYGSSVYSSNYQLIKDSSIFHLSLKRWNENIDSVKKSLVKQICLAYLEGWESIDDKNSLIRLLLNENDSHSLVVRYIKSFSKVFIPKNRPKIKSLWRYLFDYNKKTNPSLAGELTDWLVFFDELDDDDVYFWCKEGAPYIRSFMETEDFVDNLARLVNSQPRKAGEIFWALIQNPANISDNTADSVTTFVTVLYQKNEKGLADKICNRFGEHGIYFLRELYDKNNRRP